VDNVGQSKIRGFEAEASWRPNEALLLNGAFGYIDAQFEEFLRFDPAQGKLVDISHLVVFQNTPKYSAALSATLTPPIPAEMGVVQITPSVSYRSRYSQFEFPNALLDQGGYTLVDLTASYTTPSGRYRLGLEGRNLTDERYRIGGYNFPGATFGNSVIGFYGPPRTLTASFEVRF
jgi:iron complex outermembrane receptor protein